MRLFILYKTMKENCEPGDCNSLKGVIPNTALSWSAVRMKGIWEIGINDPDMAKPAFLRRIFSVRL